MVKISIVMPVHNTGRYLKEALKTIFIQSFRDFEIICVDDASEDKVTLEILQFFKSVYTNMRVINLEKTVGAAEARNIGFSMVRGEYVIFLDADDLFSHDLLEKMYCKISLNHSDVCVCGYQEFYTEDEIIYFTRKYLPEKCILFPDEQGEWLLKISTAPWNKLCKTQFLKENQILFQSLTSCNDVFYSCMVMINSDKRSFIGDTPLIFYRTGISTQISSNRNPVNLYYAIMLVKDVLEEQERVPKDTLLRWITTLLLRNGIWEMGKSRNEEYRKEFYNVAAGFLKRYPVSLKNKKYMTYIDILKNKLYEDGWFYIESGFYGQLTLMKDEIKEKMKCADIIFLWGLGERGSAFQNFCKEQRVNLTGVCDIQEINVGGMTKEGYKIISTEEVLKMNGLIIASNRKIYESLKKMDYKLNVINLEKYCPD